MKAPRKIHEYTTAEEAASGLEDMARSIRAHAEIRPLVKYLVRLDYWNPRWSDKTASQPKTIVTGVDYANQPFSKAGGEPAAGKSNEATGGKGK